VTALARRRRRRARGAAPGRAGAAAVAAVLLAACGDGDGERGRTAAERGRELFASAALSRNSFNQLACADCHATAADDPRPLPGAPLPGVVLRPSYWGGDETDLLESINACLTSFMLETKGLAPDDAAAVDLYAYLASLPPELPDARPFTVVREVADVTAAGDPARGEATYASACGWCHGAPATAEGRRVALAVVVPDETLAEHGDDPAYDVRLVFIEKIRHGRYLGFGGLMPPFSTEVLSDDDVADVLAYLGQ
jgi:thiosulfate dehydrogenase